MHFLGAPTWTILALRDALTRSFTNLFNPQSPPSGNCGLIAEPAFGKLRIIAELDFEKLQYVGRTSPWRLRSLSLTYLIHRARLREIVGQIAELAFEKLQF